MRALFNRLHFYRKYRASVRSATVGRTVKLGKSCHIKVGAVVRDSTLGPRCYVNRGAEIYSADIGPFCSIGHLAQIGPNEHLTDEITTCNELYGAALAQKLARHNGRRVTIGADVWVGARALILRGTTVGTGAIIAGGAVVTRDVPDYAIVVGLPARVVRLRYSPEVVADLVAAQWWERDLGTIRRAVDASAIEIGSDNKAGAFLAELEGG